MTTSTSTVAVDAQSLSRSARGRIAGVVYAEIDGTSLPERQWSDSVIVVLSSWLESLNGGHLVAGRPTVDSRSADQQCVGMQRSAALFHEGPGSLCHSDHTIATVGLRAGRTNLPIRRVHIATTQAVRSDTASRASSSTQRSASEVLTVMLQEAA